VTNRRQFITLLGGATAAWPLAARAEQARKVVRIGYLSPAAGPNPITGAAFEGTLQQLGWVTGNNITIDAGKSRRSATSRSNWFKPLPTKL
jgi:putative ABC transport system substrate-binding protein